MFDMPAWWGLSLVHTLLLVAAILIIIDVFFQSDIPTHVAYLLTAFAVAYSLDVHVLYRVLVGVASWFALVALHYLVWRKVLERIAHKMAPARYKDGVGGLVGTVGTVKRIDDRCMLKAQGDLWPFACQDDLQDGDQARVVGEDGGVLRVEPVRAAASPDTTD